MSIRVNRHISFIDSLQFYNGSLDTLASNLEDNDFKHLTIEFGIDKLEILKRKDTYPYKCIDSYEKFKHPSLSEKNVFIHNQKMVKEIEAMDLFLMKNTNTCKMFGKYLILIRLKIFMIII